MKSKTETIAAALRILANNIPARCLREAADRLEELEKECDMAVKALMRESSDRKKMMEQRDEARAEVERVKIELYDTVDSYKLNNLQPKTTRPEPSRLEIAAMAMQGFVASSGFIIDIPKTALEYADVLIKAAKEAK